MSKVEIIPAIMPQNFEDLKVKVLRVSQYVKFVQLDIMDGDFVPEKTWPYLGEIMDFKKLQREEMALPEWEKVNYEIDLMVSDPERDAREWIQSGAARIIIHIESHPDIKGILERMRRDYGRANEIPSAPEIGIAIDTDTALEKLEELLPMADFLQHMGIDKIGYQGQPFSEKAIERITFLKKKYPELIISVDGAVNDETAPELLASGVTRLVSGSYIYKSLDAKEAIESLKI